MERTTNKRQKSSTNIINIDLNSKEDPVTLYTRQKFCIKVLGIARAKYRLQVLTSKSQRGAYYNYKDLVDVRPNEWELSFTLACLAVVQVFKTDILFKEIHLKVKSYNGSSIEPIFTTLHLNPQDIDFGAAEAALSDNTDDMDEGDLGNFVLDASTSVVEPEFGNPLNIPVLPEVKTTLPRFHNDAKALKHMEKHYQEYIKHYEYRQTTENWFWFSLNRGCKHLFLYISFAYTDMVHRRNQNDETPLHVVLRNSSCPEKFILMLIGMLQDVNTLDGAGFSPVDIAYARGLEKVMGELVLRGCNQFGKYNTIPKQEHALWAQDQRKQYTKMNQIVIDRHKFQHEFLPIHWMVFWGLAGMVADMARLGERLDVAIGSKKQQLIHIAAESGKAEVVEALIKLGVPLDVRDGEGECPIHLAAKQGHTKVIELIVELGGSVEERTIEGKQAIHIATIAGHTKVVERLIALGSDINSMDMHGFTPIQIAYGEKHLDLIEKLGQLGAIIYPSAYKTSKRILTKLSEKVEWTARTNMAKRGPKEAVTWRQIPVKDIDIMNRMAQMQIEDDGFLGSTILDTPLIHEAAEQGRTEVLSYLIALGSRVDQTNEWGQQAIHLASERGHTKTVQRMIELGAKIDAEDATKRQPIHYAASWGHLTTIKKLVELGARLDATDEKNDQPIHLAYFDFEIVVELILLGAQVDAVGNEGDQVIHLASRWNKFDLITVLVGFGANIHALNALGMRPIHIAAKSGSIEAVKALVELGASLEDPDVTNELQAIHYATAYGGCEIVEALLDMGAKVDATGTDGIQPIHSACENHDTDVAELLFKRGAKLNAKTKDHTQPILIAASNENIRMVKKLLELGASVDDAAIDGTQAIHFAAGLGNREILDILVDAGARIDSPDLEGRQPIHYAAVKGKFLTIRKLVAMGASVDAEDADGNRPLHYAAESGFKRVIEALVSLNANPEAWNKKGEQPIHKAAAKGMGGVVRVLTQGNLAALRVVDGNGNTPLEIALVSGHPFTARTISAFTSTKIIVELVGASEDYTTEMLDAKLAEYAHGDLELPDPYLGHEEETITEYYNNNKEDATPLDETNSTFVPSNFLRTFLDKILANK